MMCRTSHVLFAVWLVIAVFVGYLFASLASSRQSVELRVHDEARSCVRLVEEHAAATFDSANIALLEMEDHLTPADLTGPGQVSAARRREIEKRLQSQVQRRSGIVTMYLTNAQGLVIADPRGAPPGASVADRQYFQTLRQLPQSTPVISQAIRGRVSGQWGIVLGRRIDLSDGSFGGMLGANLALDRNFTDFYSTLTLGKHGAVSLRDPEDHLIVRYPLVEKILGKPVAAGGPVKERLQAGDTEGVIVAASAIDNIERVFAFRRLKDYPVYAAVGLSLDEALVGWRRDRDVAVVGAMLVILAGGFITIVLRRKDRAENQLKTLAVIVESSQDAISTANMTGIITSWNGGAQRVYGYSAEEAVGQHSALIVPPEKLEEHALLLERIGAGGSAVNLETARLTKNGQRIDVSLTVSPIQARGGGVAGYSTIARDITERKRMEAELHEMAATDFLTGVSSRRLFISRIEMELARLQRLDRHCVSVLMIDLDRFKRINDTYGHATGDAILIHCAAIMRECLRKIDTVGRMGGEEFAILLPGTDLAAASIFAERLRLKVAETPIVQDAQTIAVTVSIGIAAMHADDAAADAALNRADDALYRAKKAGRNRLEIDAPEAT
ncbi:MAG: diguanylate cyclase [Sterolibacterium sp.]